MSNYFLVIWLHVANLNWWEIYELQKTLLTQFARFWPDLTLPYLVGVCGFNMAGVSLGKIHFFRDE